MRTLIGVLLLVSVASDSRARLLNVSSEIVNVPGAPAGYVVNQMRIDFEGQLFGQQMIVKLDSGSLYNNGFGGETAPNGLLIPTFPDLEADTFVTIGGATLATSESTLVVGGSTEFPESSGTKLFDNTGIDIAWAPSPGVVVTDQTGYLVAQLTLSNDANGVMEYYGNGEHWGIDRGGQHTIYNGVIWPPGWPIADPEPSSALLAWVALLGVMGRRR